MPPCISKTWMMRIWQVRRDFKPRFGSGSLPLVGGSLLMDPDSEPLGRREHWVPLIRSIPGVLGIAGCQLESGRASSSQQPASWNHNTCTFGEETRPVNLPHKMRAHNQIISMCPTQAIQFPKFKPIKSQYSSNLHQTTVPYAASQYGTLLARSGSTLAQIFHRCHNR